jgi:hypothetical protein
VSEREVVESRDNLMQKIHRQIDVWKGIVDTCESQLADVKEIAIQYQTEEMKLTKDVKEWRDFMERVEYKWRKVAEETADFNPIVEILYLEDRQLDKIRVRRHGVDEVVVIDRGGPFWEVEQDRIEELFDTMKVQ